MNFDIGNKKQNRCMFLFKIYFFHSSLYLSYCWTGTNTEVLRPRGVSLAAKVFYVPSKDFSCLDGSGKFPFHFVNDDYCDCADGSDEPGTAACPNGRFHCSNLGYISKEIPASRVNDRICDCCDGSDEYKSSIDCINLCIELGKEARAAAQKQQELFEKGYQLWQEYSSQGKQKKESNKIKIQELNIEKEAAEKVKQEKEALKNEAEVKETAAMSKYEAFKAEAKAIAEAAEKLTRQEEEKSLAEQAFKDLDFNHDGFLTVDEVQKFPKFDSDNDGVVSEKEGKLFLNMKESMSQEEFIASGWMVMKPVYMLDKIPLTTVSPTEVVVEHEKNAEDEYYDAFGREEDFPDEMLEGDEDEEDKNLEPPAFPPNEESEKENAQKPPNDEPYDDEETQKLVDDATNARKEFKAAVEKLDNIQDEIRQLQADIETDFGSEEQFGVLKGQCFDFDEREYTYQLCPFDRASQIPKSGGYDVSLGRWGHWAGPEENKYTKMKYENGQGCWNGPARSTMVILHCGVENKLLSASEPNRCEYLLEFTTPSLCSNPQDKNKMHEHTEL